MVHVEQRGLCTFEKDRSSFSRCDVQIVSSVGDEWPKTLRQHRHLFKDLVSVQTLAAVGFDDAVCILEVSLDARTEHVRNERVGGANTTPAGFVFVGWSNTAQSSADFFIAESLFARVVQGTVIRKD